MKTILITGSSRGLGLEFVKQYLKRGERIIATCRNPSSAKELTQLQKNNPESIMIEKLDVSDDESRDQLFHHLSNKLEIIDLLINNAGIIAGNEEKGSNLGEIHKEDLCKVFLVNSVSPILVAEKFLPLLEKSSNPIIVNISSMSGCITNRTRGGGYSYSSSKAALNMMTKTLSNDLKERKIIAIVVHPGWVVTDMGGENAPLKPQESISGMIKVIDSLNIEDTGKFLDWEGNELPW